MSVKSKVKTNIIQSVYTQRQSEQQRRNEEKVKILDQHSCSEDLFNELATLINTLSQDESRDTFKVTDDYNFGTEYEVELILDLLGDLRMFTRFNHCDDDESITEFNLDYLRPYF